MLYPVPSLPTSGVLRATELLRLLGARSLRQALGEFRTSTSGLLRPRRHCRRRQDHGEAGGELRQACLGLGKIEGMLPERIHAYVADWRLVQLRIAPVFGFFEAKEGGFTQLRAHPLPWLVEILNGVEHANFFEQRATEYSKAATRPQPLVGSSISDLRPRSQWGQEGGGPRVSTATFPRRVSCPQSGTCDVMRALDHCRVVMRSFNPIDRPPLSDGRRGFTEP